MALEGIKAKPGTGADPEFSFVSADDGSGNTRKIPRGAIILTDNTTVTPLKAGPQTPAESVPTTTAGTSFDVCSISVTTTATKLGTGASGAPLANRKRLRFVNNGPSTIYVGNASVTTTAGTNAGIPYVQFGSDVLELTAAVDIYARTASGTADVRILEEA